MPEQERDERGRFAGGGLAAWAAKRTGTKPPEATSSSLPQLQTHEAKPAEFHAAFQAAFKGNEFSNHVTHYTPEQLAGMKCLLSADGKSGVALHDHGDGRVEATALFNNGGPKGGGLAMLKEAIKAGANYVECYGPALNKMYEKLGFKEADRFKFDPSMAAASWDSKKFDSPDYVTMRLGS